MAGFHTKTFLRHDDYMTPKHAWEDIQEYIPKDKIIWEAFYGDGSSGKYLEELGYNVIHEKEDFFLNNKGDVLDSNPPFTLCKTILPRLKELEKPFILIMPCSKLTTSYIRETFMNAEDKLQIIIPRKRIHFIKKIGGADGDIPEGWKNACNFDCFYYCYKMNLPRDILWLDKKV